MGARSDIESLSLTEQAVLLAVTELQQNDETPAQTHDLRRVCRERLTDVDTDTEVIGTITEADVMRSLYRLEADGIVDEEQPDERSPTGKGRPAYSLSEPADAVYDAVADGLVEGMEVRTGPDS